MPVTRAQSKAGRTDAAATKKVSFKTDDSDKENAVESTVAQSKANLKLLRAAANSATQKKPQPLSIKGGFDAPPRRGDIFLTKESATPTKPVRHQPSKGTPTPVRRDDKKRDKKGGESAALPGLASPPKRPQISIKTGGSPVKLSVSQFNNSHDSAFDDELSTSCSLYSPPKRAPVVTGASPAKQLYPSGSDDELASSYSLFSPPKKLPTLPKLAESPFKFTASPIKKPSKIPVPSPPRSPKEYMECTPPSSTQNSPLLTSPSKIPVWSPRGSPKNCLDATPQSFAPGTPATTRTTKIPIKSPATSPKNRIERASPGSTSNSPAFKSTSKIPVRSPPRSANVRAIKSAPSTPGTATISPPLKSTCLSGAIVFVDVWTSEGASGLHLFEEGLKSVGAKVVKQWNWNPATDPQRKKIGITHVLFKEGSKRTLEKVRETNGLVKCVGAGWAATCEQDCIWADESRWEINTSEIPRGGHNRRKSMEPRAVPNTETKRSPTKEFLNLTPFATPAKKLDFALEEIPIVTPSERKGVADGNVSSPNTPYWLHPKQLVQHTCPQKPVYDVFAELDRSIERHSDEYIKRRVQNMKDNLLAARAKSLEWSPPLHSPLASGTSV